MEGAANAQAQRPGWFEGTASSPLCVREGGQVGPWGCILISLKTESALLGTVQ